MNRVSPKREKKLRAANGGYLPSSTIAKSAKPLTKPRRSPVRNTARKALPKSNPERQQRMAVIRRQKHSAYRRSDCYKAVEQRSEGRCERMVLRETPLSVNGKSYRVWMRCPNARRHGLRMTHNHKTYARYGGKELPGDMELLCPSCNASYESQKRGNRRFKVVA